MKIEKNYIIVNENGKVKDGENCPFMNYIKGPSCNHPRAGENEILCKYGLTEISVPKNCPLREGSITLTKTIELKVSSIKI